MFSGGAYILHFGFSQLRQVVSSAFESALCPPRSLKSVPTQAADELADGRRTDTIFLGKWFVPLPCQVAADDLERLLAGELRHRRVFPTLRIQHVST